MVKGSSVRTIVAAYRDTDCYYEPKSKQKDVSPTVLVAANRSITHFFHAVSHENEKSKEENERKDFGFDEVLSPPTPHRIELHQENGKILVRDPVCYTPKSVAPPKSRRRLNTKTIAAAFKDVDSSNHKLTEFFPVRRSVRKTKTLVQEEKQKTLELILRNDIEEGLKVSYFDEKGRGVVADRLFEKGDFVVEYSGELINTNEAKIRERKYAQDLNTGCYMYYFKHNSQQYCIDATAETGRLGRLVNHSRNGNLVTRTVSVDNRPRLILVAKETIEKGTEVTYDYGDRSRESLKHHPWLAY